MTPDITPNGEPNVPHIEPGAQIPAQAPISDGQVASEYLARELAAARVSLRRTQVIGAIFIIVVLIETIYVSGNMQKYMQPANAAEIADGMIAQRVQEQAPAIKDAIKQKIPALIAQLPDEAIQQMPGYRESFENRFESDLTGYATSSSQKLDGQLGDYLAAHKDEVKDALTSGKDSAAVHQLGAGLTDGFVASLKDTSEGGESVQTKLDKSLAALQEVQAKMDHLANGKNLTPEEKKTRHMIAIMSRTIGKNVPSANLTQAMTNAGSATETEPSTTEPASGGAAL